MTSVGTVGDATVRADTASADADVASCTHVDHLPSELLALTLEWLGDARELLAARAVSQRWQVGISDFAWRRHFFERCPFAASWARFGPAQDGHGDWLRCYLRLCRLTSRLRSAWTADFREQFQVGKYSRWVCDREDSNFVLPLLFAVRLLGLTLPSGYARLDGAAERQYAPEHSTSSSAGGGGWSPLDAEHAQLTVGRDAYLGLHIIRLVDLGLDGTDDEEGEQPGDRSMRTTVDEHLGSWWGGEGARRAALLAQLFEPRALLVLAEFVLEDLPAGCRGRLNSLFWDCDGAVCRGVQNLAAEAWAEFPETARGDFLFGRRLNHRQLPPIFNICKLAEHAAALSLERGGGRALER